MRSFTIIVCLLALFLAAFINADGITPRKARGKARSSLQGFHSKLWREHLKNPAIKKAENRGGRKSIILGPHYLKSLLAVVFDSRGGEQG